jgi:oligopeptide transport system permease protein
MVKYFIKRVFASIITLWVVVTVTFFMAHAIPGGPFTSEKKLPPAVVANLNAKYGLDKPLPEQYLTYLGNAVHGDLGVSMGAEGRRINDIISYSFPTSAKIGLVAVLVSLLVGIYLGVLAALHQSKWQDGLSMVVATIGVTVPSFVVGTLLMYVFAIQLAWLPAVGFDGPLNYIMPVIALAAFPTAFITRYTRSMLVDVLKQDYIRTAKAKGLSQSIVTYKHALRNSLIPIITYLGPLIAGILTGSFVVEQIFGIPGIGKEFVLSILDRDYTTILGVTIFFSALLIACNLVVDILYAIVDPRIRLDS